MRRYDAEITSSQWKSYPPSRFRAVVRGSTSARSFAPHPRLSQRRVKASSIPSDHKFVRSISPVTAGVYGSGLNSNNSLRCFSCRGIAPFLW
ncbi:MAG: hypothetical protein DMD30_10470 [Gemmatimonadetes bacterium]|nr:MAG: hypothetical protein DMD30_10470 [Gemmatimonadota bacterium]